MSRGQSQTRTDSRRRALGKCKCKSSTESVVIIDVDSSNDVFIINSPENSHHVPTTSRSPWKNTSPDNVISIDDDDEEIDDNPTTANHASTSKSSNRMFNCASLSKELDDDGDDDDECQMYVKDGNYSAKLLPKYGYPRNRYGLDFVPDSRSSGGSTSESGTSEVESSDYDSSDCEIMDDTSGEIRKNWERAASRKRMSEGVQISSEDWTSFSGSTSDLGTQSHETAVNNEENCCLNETYADHHHKTPAECSPNNSYNIENNLPSDEPMEDFLFCATNLDPFTGISHNEPVFQKEELIPEKCSTQSQPPDSNQLNGAGACSCEPSVWVDNGHANYPEKMEEEIFLDSSCHSQLPHDFIDSPEIAAYEKEKSFMSRKAWPNNQQTEESQLNNNCFQTSFKEVILEKTFGHHYAGSRGEMSCSSNAESQVQNGLVSHSEKPRELTVNDNTLDVQNNLIIDREKHKESAEFRRVAEEEWASRQRQLQIQAEEAQRLRRRRKAESLRLLHMEKRQKQRLEEIRESQKKDEETINLKEQIRVEVRKELEIMELRCKDMASVLRELGIHVEGGLFPLHREINSACKQALRKFHPDRFSRSDIRQQVKAEETFKFISRLKEKLHPFS
uniref:J domain-containing protein n=1 Tax=Ananas comosus var. bracteatus TaxID=296719 RepID=A0A6V7QDU3_ANACO|nr:unnamed protein product [Ananas comosus var. bracteatus]